MDLALKVDLILWLPPVCDVNRWLVTPFNRFADTGHKLDNIRVTGGKLGIPLHYLIIAMLKKGIIHEFVGLSNTVVIRLHIPQTTRHWSY